MRDMFNKEIATVRKATGELIGGFFLYGILFGILYSIVYNLVVAKFASNSLMPKAIIAIILQGITVFLIWQSSTASTFKKRNIYRDDVPTVMRNLVIFTIIICIGSAIVNFAQVNSTIDKMVETDVGLKLREGYMSYLYSDEQMAEYEVQKKQAITEAKGKLYGYLAVLEVGLLAVYLGVLPLEKNMIMKYSV